MSSGISTITPEKNPFRAKHPWPPDFSTLNPRHQFRLERRYKRRAQLKWARPKLMAFTRLAQWGAGVGILVYGVLFYEWDGAKDGRESAFQSTREWWSRTVGELGVVRGSPGKKREGT